MRQLGYTIFQPGAVTSWIRVITMRPGNHRRLQEVTAPSQKIVQHINPLKTTACHYCTFVVCRSARRSSYMFPTVAGLYAKPN